VVEIREWIKRGCRGYGGRRQGSEVGLRQDDEVVQVGNEVVGEVQGRS
jgi:hypothetical protein